MTVSRRRFLRLASAACLIGPAAQAYQWQGTALGAHAAIILDHPNAEEITRRALAEITRLEDIFSLYRSTSEITRLNDAGRVDAPSFELLECLTVARNAHQVTQGRFDPTVQPLWRALAEAYSAGHAPDDADLDAARQAVGFERVTLNGSAVVLSPGQQITLNGIAQGYIADRIAVSMRAEGIEDVLIDTGEIIALGAPRGSDAWPVTIVGEVTARALTGRALATSSPLGTVLDGDGKVGHIVNPRSGDVAVTNIRQVSVSARSAALADALSTGLCLAQNSSAAYQMLRNLKDARLESVQTISDAT